MIVLKSIESITLGSTTDGKAVSLPRRPYRLQDIYNLIDAINKAAVLL
jgi:hypothetical protein